MKSIHVPFVFYPDAVGGTEVYVASLCAALSAQGHSAVVAAPGTRDEYVYEGLRVHRFEGDADLHDVSDLYGAGDVKAAAAFGAILDREQPDVVHLHAFTRACSLELVRAAHRRDVPVVFTYHTPTVTCQRGTLMRWGAAPCDGTLNVRRCTACALHGHDVPKPIAQLMATIPESFGRRLAASRRSGGPWTALRFSALMAERHAAVRALVAEVDRIVSLGEWSERLLLANGVAATKIVRSRHGLPARPTLVNAPSPRTGDTLRIAFLGRFDRTKGLDTLVRAFDHIPRDVRVQLTVYGATQGAEGERVQREAQQLAARETRIEFKARLDQHRVVEELSHHDLLAVPSRWMETGPLVILEAFSAGVPVVGSALGGIAELVEDGGNGILVSDYESPAAWARVFVDAARSPASLDRLRRGVRKPKSMEVVAREMTDVYGAVTAPRAWAPEYKLRAAP